MNNSREQQEFDWRFFLEEEEEALLDHNSLNKLKQLEKRRHLKKSPKDLEDYK